MIEVVEVPQEYMWLVATMVVAPVGAYFTVEMISEIVHMIRGTQDDE